jgi:hypothetical protein
VVQDKLPLHLREAVPATPEEAARLAAEHHEPVTVTV